MKRLLRILCVLFSISLCFTGSIQAAEAFVIDNVHIEMKVHEDGSMDIVETYQLNFSEYRHGFYRTIPTTYHQTWEMDGSPVEKSYYFPISKITCNTAFEIDESYDGVSIKLGDADHSVIGKQNYQISYHVQTKDLDLNGIQMLYWNLIGNFNTTIRDFSYRIEMPKAFSAEDVYTYTGRYGASGDDLSFKVEGNTITGNLTSSMRRNSNATIMIHLPDDYFTFPEPKNYEGTDIALILLILLISGGLFYRYGKDDEVIVSVEFTAPDGLDSAAAGYIVDQYADNKDILSLILIWANQGYLKIHDQPEGFRLEKLKDMDPNENKAYECLFFHALFEKKDLVSEEDLKKQQVSNALHKSKSALGKYFQHKDRKVFLSASTALQVLMLFVLILPQAIVTFTSAYAAYEIVLLVWPFMMVIPFLFFCSIPWILLMRKHYAMKRSTYFICTSLMMILTGVLLMINVGIQLYLKASWYVVLLAFVASVLLILMMMFMDKRSPQGNRWLGQILGLKEFIESCEKDRIELLAKDDPYAFFEILPYAYVLGVSDIWVKKFEDIVLPYPDWYDGYSSGNLFFSMLWWNHFHYCFRDISKAATYVPPAKSGSGGASFGSGGFGGGGGFSGGGFGGGGGGSW